MKRKPFFNFQMFVLAALAPMFFVACSDDDPEPENESEVVTTVVLTFTPTAGGTPLVVRSQDLDGDGPNNPVTDEIVLAASTSYTLEVQFLNEQLPASDEDYNITAEVEEEGDEHQVFFEANPDALFSAFSYEDEDVNGRPIGLSAALATGAAGTGTLNVILKHQPGGIKTATSGVDDGETDVQRTFNVTIE